MKNEKKLMVGGARRRKQLANFTRGEENADESEALNENLPSAKKRAEN